MSNSNGSGDLGDPGDPGMWMTASEMIRNHPSVGEYVWINDDPNISTLQGPAAELKGVYGPSGLRVTITGVLLQNGIVGGYEVEDAAGNVHVGHIRDFYASGNKQIAENNLVIHSAMVNRIRKIMRHWDSPKEYYGPYWAGIEKIYARLAPIIRMAAFEAPDSPTGESSAWYRYPNDKLSSPNSNNSQITSAELDGKDWRMILPIALHPVEVNFHSIIGVDLIKGNGSVWSLTTTVMDKPLSQLDTDNIILYGHPDPWKRSMIWAIETTKILEIPGIINYKKVRQDMLNRIGFASILQELKIPILAQMHYKYEQIMGDNGYAQPEYITITVNKWDLPVGKESYYMPPHYDTDLGWIFWGTVIIHPDLAKKPKLARMALIHQLAHSLFNTSCVSHCNEQMTQEMYAIIESITN